MDVLQTWLERLLYFAYPWWSVLLAIAIGVLVVIAPVPLTLEHKDMTMRDWLMIQLRKAMLLLLFVTVLLFPAAALLKFGLFDTDPVERWTDYMTDILMTYWPVIALGVVLGCIFKFYEKRYVAPWISSYLRKIRTQQETEKPSDIRDEIGKYKAKNFNPQSYYEIEKKLLFLGLNENNQPVHMPLEEYRKRNMMCVGPSQFGKGVLNGVVLDQLIAAGDIVWYFDPKPDLFVPYILKAAAEKYGRPFVYCDLNDGGHGKWSPFSGGTLREKRQRLINAFGLGDTGTDADFYKLNERSLLDSILEKTDGHLASMLDEAHRAGDDSIRLRESLKEWAKIDTFHARRDGRSQFSVERSIENRAVVYIRGSQTDAVVKKAMRVMIVEALQTKARLQNEKKLPPDCFATFAVDETRFVISDELASAAATCLSSQSKLIISAQTIRDFRNLEDKTLNAEAIESALFVNCQHKLYYCALDADTAEWVARSSGTGWNESLRSESTSVNKYGGETWGDARQIVQTESAYVTINKISSLPERVGVLFRPNTLAETIFTCWVAADKSADLYKAPKQKEPSAA